MCSVLVIAVILQAGKALYRNLFNTKMRNLEIYTFVKIQNNSKVLKNCELQKMAVGSAVVRITGV